MDILNISKFNILSINENEFDFLTLLDVLPNRNKETVAGYLSRLPNREQIQYVTMDMWQPYKDAAG